MNQLYLRNLLMGLTLGLLLWTPPPGWAGCDANVPATTPTVDFTLDDVNGLATHRKTGLTWMRCALGQVWDQTNKTCTGTPSTYTWEQALQVAESTSFAGAGDWRLPNVKELGSIVEESCYEYAVNATVFPGMVGNAWYWSSSVYASDPGYTWGVFFPNGYVLACSKTDNGSVRLARGGQ